MKKHIWADPKKKWDGFRFTAYFLDPDKVETLPLTEWCRTDGKAEQVSTTLGKIYASLADRHFEIDPEFGVGVEITTGSEKLEFSGPSFNCKVLHELLRLRKEGFEPFSGLWFCYDTDSCRTDPHEIYRFFVVYDDKIVRESVSFSDYPGSGFDPTVFARYPFEPIWSNDDARTEARSLFWYRKFCQETETGQRMMLRRDRPGVVRFLDPWPFLRRDSPIASLLWRLLPESVVLRWVVIVVGILVVLRLWR